MAETEDKLPPVPVSPGMFRCEMCGGLFECSDDAEARAEAEAKGVDPEESGLVCDRCYERTPWGITDIMVDAAFGKAVQFGLLCPPGWPDGGKRDREIVREVLRAALGGGRFDA